MEKKLEHIPVLLKEVLTEIKVPSDDFIVDCTLGMGGHSKQILESSNTVNLICFDLYKKSILLFEKYLLEQGFLKKNSVERVYEKGSKLVYLINDNFANLELVLDRLKVHQIGLVLADLGLSTFQIKKSKRGFSFLKLEEPLDMRISLTNTIKAYDLLNSLSENELCNLFKNFGESEFSSGVAKRVVAARKIKKLKTVGDFLKVINLKKLPGKIHPATKLFMALRIAVNRENENLKMLLTTFFKLDIQKLLIITFHSLEARYVTNFVRANKFQIKEILPSTSEISDNKSSRSAKLYVIQK